MVMRSLQDILSEHGPVLALDAAGTAQAAWFEGHEARWAAEPGEPGIALFRALERVAPDPGRAAAFVFCSQPGSVLGIRTVAVVLRMWRVLKPRPVYAYHGLELLAAGRPPAGSVGFIADARRGMWHWAAAGERATRLESAQVAERVSRGASLAMPEGFRAWDAAPGPIHTVPYSIAELFEAARTAPLLVEAPEPDAELTAAPAYAEWTPRIHAAP